MNKYSQIILQSILDFLSLKIFCVVSLGHNSDPDVKTTSSVKSWKDEFCKSNYYLWLDRC